MISSHLSFEDFRYYFVVLQQQQKTRIVGLVDVMNRFVGKKWLMIDKKIIAMEFHHFSLLNLLEKNK